MKQRQPLLRTKPTWTVNEYDAAACIASAEINRKMLEAYDTTDDFPKNWQVQDPRLADKGANKGQPSPRWKIAASSIGAPSVTFATAIENGVNLNTTVLEGSSNTWSLIWTQTPRYHGRRSTCAILSLPCRRICPASSITRQRERR